jgi:hypothetical protein
MAIVYTDFDFPDDYLHLVVENLVEQFQIAFDNFVEDFKPTKEHSGSFEIQSTRGQSESELWHIIRMICLSASVCHRVCKMKSANSIKNFLRQHLWGLDKVMTKAMRYGNEKESSARQAYIEMKQKEDPFVYVEVPGTCMHTEYKGLSCSLDGIVCSQNTHPKGLEIKCPYSLRNKNINAFEKHLSRTKLKSFCLSRQNDNKIILKENHPYYDQLQMQMGIMGYSETDFFVWSKEGHVCVTVSFNEERWKSIAAGLTDFRLKILIPEYFTMKTPRNLNPISLP